MKFLTTEKNNGFVTIGDDVFYAKTHTKIFTLDRHPISFNGIPIGELKQFNTGVMTSKESFANKKIEFYRNDGSKLFEVSNKTLDVLCPYTTASVCSSGVLVTNGGDSLVYEYYFYDGTKLEDEELMRLVKNVKIAENKKGIFDEKIETKGISKKPSATKLVSKFVDIIDKPDDDLKFCK